MKCFLALSGIAVVDGDFNSFFGLNTQPRIASGGFVPLEGNIALPSIARPPPGGYDISDLTTSMNPAKFESMQTACQKYLACQFFCDPLIIGCVTGIGEIETEIMNSYKSVDVDLGQIFQRLYVTKDGVVSMEKGNTDMANWLDQMNITLRGDVNTSQTGLVRDVITMGDGINEIKNVIKGQSRSIKDSSRSQNVELKKLSRKIQDVTRTDVSDYMQDKMMEIVGARTGVQSWVTDAIIENVNATAADMGSQAVDAQNDFSNGYDELKKRYDDMSSATAAAIEATTQRSIMIRSMMQNLTRTIPLITKDSNTAALNELRDTITEITGTFGDSYNKALHAIETDTTGIKDSLMQKILTNRNEFATDMQGIWTDLRTNVSSIYSYISNSDSKIAASEDTQTRDNLKRQMAALAASLHALWGPLKEDFINQLRAIKALRKAIETYSVATDVDIRTQKNKAIRDIGTIDSHLRSSQNDTRTDFNTNMGDVKSGMNSQIFDRVDKAKRDLEGIVGSFNDGASGDVKTQNLVGNAASMQSSASRTSADLLAAKQKLAGDQASTSLSTMVGVVANAISDTQSSLTDIDKNNLSKLLSSNQEMNAQQQAMIQAAYAKLQGANQSARGASNAVQDSFLQAEATGQDLEDNVAMDGAKLDMVARAQNRQANQILGEINDMLAVTQQKGGSLSDQVAALEKQAPAMVGALKEKIAAYQQLMVEQGRSSQSSVSSNVGNQATGVLGGLSDKLQSILGSSAGVTTDMASKQTAAQTEQANLVGSLSVMQSQLQQQAIVGQAAIKANAQKAMTFAVNVIRGSGNDSADALTSLLQFDTSMVDSKKEKMMAAGASALNATLSAAQYLEKSALKFQAITREFVGDSHALSNSATTNLSQVLDSVNASFIAVRSASDAFMNSLTQFNDRVTDFPRDVKGDANVVKVQISSKLAQVNTLISQAGNSIDTKSLESYASELNEYIDNLVATIQQQRAAFNKQAQEYAVRRIAEIVGLSETIVAQKATFLGGLSKSDASEDDVASATTGALQSLLGAVERLKNSGSTDMTSVSNLISSIGNGVNSVTNSLARQMQSTVTALQMEASSAVANTGNDLKSTVDATSVAANSIGNAFLNALKNVGNSQAAAKMSANAGQSDVYGLTGMLSNLDQSTKLKIAGLLQQVQGGNMTMSEAMSAARSLQQSQITSVYSVAQSLAGFIGQHEAMVDAYSSRTQSAKGAITESYTGVLNEHIALEGDIASDMSSSRDRMKNLRASLLVPDPIKNTTPLNASVSDVSSNITSMELRINKLMFGTQDISDKAMDTSTWFNPGVMGSFVQNDTTNNNISVAQNLTFPDIIATLTRAITNASVNLETNRTGLQAQVARNVQAGTNIIKTIVGYVKSALNLT